MLNELETVPGCIIVGRNPKNMWYTDITVDGLFGKKTTWPPIEVSKEKVEKWINHQLKEDIKYGDQQVKKSERCELQIGDIIVKQVQKYKLSRIFYALLILFRDISAPALSWHI